MPLRMGASVRGTVGIIWAFALVLSPIALAGCNRKVALQRRAAKGITVKNVGPVDASFQKVTVYATDSGRVAVGIDLSAQMTGKPRTKTSAIVWLTGTLFNEPNSAVLSVRDLAINGDTSNSAVNLAIRLFTEPSMVQTVQDALVEDLSKDYDHVITAAKNAVRQRRQGDVIVSAEIDNVQSGRIEATGEGLFLPVRATGNATILYRPAK